jgi:DNA repair exonuclease SbcCD nuclease subunit
VNGFGEDKKEEMKMRVIHCADLHLDSNLLTNLDVQKSKERNLELLENFQEMIAYGEEQGVKAVLISGDLFDTSEPSETTKRAVLKMVEEHPKIFFFYLRGNHDRDVIIGDVLPANFITFDDCWKHYVCGSVTISGVECQGDSLRYTEEPEFPKERVNIIMLHGMVVETMECKSEDDKVFINRFKNKNIDYVALGHFHGYRKNRLDERGVYCYSGCLEGRGFDECGQKGFVLLDIDEEYCRVNSRFVPFGKRQLFDLPVNVQECMTSIEMARCIDSQLEVSGAEKEDLVKVRLVGSIDVECEKNLRYLKHKFENDFYCFKIEDHTVIHVDYSDYVIDETLKGEFVRMIHHADIPQEDKAEIIRYGILALAGEELAE